MIRTVYEEAPVDLRAEPGDTLQIETQYDEKKGTVLYIHVNGETVFRVQNLSRGSQLVDENPINMEGRS